MRESDGATTGAALNADGCHAGEREGGSVKVAAATGDSDGGTDRGSSEPDQYGRTNCGGGEGWTTATFVEGGETTTTDSTSAVVATINGKT